MGEQTYSLLTVEDDPEARALLGRLILLAFPHLTLLAAENGKAGLDLYRLHRPDIVLTDIKMPVMNGIEMASEIRRLDPGAVIAFVSAYCDTAPYQGSAGEIGVRHLVTKPVDYNTLFATIRDCIDEVAAGAGRSPVALPEKS